MSEVRNLLERFQTESELQKEFVGIVTFNGGKSAFLFKRNHKIYYLGEEFVNVLGRNELAASSPRELNTGGNSGIRGFSVGGCHFSLLDQHGRVFCSGYKDYCGINISTGYLISPQRVSLPIIKYVICGFSCSLALSVDNELFFWGKLFLDDFQTPIKIDLPQDVIVQSISAGYSHAAVLDSRGQVYTWGFNKWGQLGHSSNAHFVEKPTLVKISKKCKFVICAKYLTGFVTIDGEFYVSGTNPKEKRIFRPSEIKGCGCVVEIAASITLNTFAVRNSNGLVFEWRKDNYWSKPELKRTVYRHVVKVFKDEDTPSIMPISDGDFQGVIKKVNWEDFSED